MIVESQMNIKSVYQEINEANSNSNVNLINISTVKKGNNNEQI